MPKPELTGEQRLKLEEWARSLEQTAPMFPDLAGLLPAADTAVTPEVVDELEATPF